MLVLSRREGERIILADENSQTLAEIYVSEIRLNCVRIGIEAPRNVQIHREEVFLAMQTPEPTAVETPQHSDTLESVA